MGMNFSFYRWIGLLVFVCVSIAQTICPRDFASAVEKKLAEFKDDLETAQFALKFDYVRSDGSAEHLFSSREDTYMLPASNNKLPTCSAAWLAFGNDYTYKTTFIYDPQEKSVTIHLAGDPSITLSALQRVVKELAEKGIGPVEEVIVDGCIFTGSPFPPTWQWEDLCLGYGTPPTAAVLDENVLLISVSRGSGPSQEVSLNFSSPAHQYAASDFVVPQASTETVSPSSTSISANYQLGDKHFYIDGVFSIHQTEPVHIAASIQRSEMFFGRVSAYLLNPNNPPSVKVLRCSKTENNPHYQPKAPNSIAAVIESPPLKDLLRHTLKESDNLYAELFAKNLGGSTVDGLKKAYQLLCDRFNLNSSMGFHFHQSDGSGVSRENMMTVQSLSLLLHSLATKLPSDQFSTFLHFLPIAGVDGTLANRFVNTSAQGIVFAKTGTLGGVSALSGYMQHSHFPTTVFSLLLNQAALSTDRQRTILDQVVLLLPQLRLC